MGDYDGAAYAKMSSVVGVSHLASDAENFGQTMCQAIRMGRAESEIAASERSSTSRLTTRGTSYTARNITSARATTGERPDERSSLDFDHMVVIADKSVELIMSENPRDTL